MIIFQENLTFTRRSLILFRFCVRPLCELQLVAALDAKDIRHHPHLELRTGTDMAFFQGQERSIERGENHFRSGMWRVLVIDIL